MENLLKKYYFLNSYAAVQALQNKNVKNCFVPENKK
ncbi:Uncharacterised protein [Legionella beliardensis]|uniref:Uncharacterized protein n=1 Tax=Legionella beliardensis TaxID=91822 RepID=A0A378HXQ5_9GAMM|nr:Uncharacterised protein [Legionella beliardensis]